MILLECRLELKVVNKRHYEYYCLMLSVIFTMVAR